MLSLSPVALYHGPNPFSDEQVLVARLTCADADWGHYSDAMERLASASCDWYLQEVSGSSASSDLRLGHFVTDWSLQCLTFVRGYLEAKGCQRETGRNDLLLWIGWHDAGVALETLRTAIKLLDAALLGELTAEQGQAEIVRIWRSLGDRHPDYQARIIMEAARPKGISYAPAWSLPRYWRFGEGARSRVLFESTSTDDSFFGGRIAASKSTTKNVLRSLGLPTPEFRLMQREEEVSEAAQAVGFPCVTKPIDRGGGKGVSAGLLSVDAARRGFRAARAASPGPVLIEGHLEGEDHRLMVVEGELVAAIRREPPTVIGDGKRTIQELVAKKNIGRDPRSLVRSGYLRPIRLDASAELHLSSQGLSPDVVLAEGQTIRVRSNANLSTGGICIDVTHVIHPEIRSLAESLGETLQLSMMGADYLTTDISRSPREIPGGFIEINTTPALDVMVAAGWPTEKAGALALTADIGTIHKTLMVVPADRLERLVSGVMTAIEPAGIGWATQDQAAVAGAALAVPKAQGWPGVDLLLNHRAVRQAIILTSDQQIMRLGMPVARVDHLMIAANLPPAWERVLTAKADAYVLPGPMALPEDLIAAVLQQIGGRAAADNEVPA